MPRRLYSYPLHYQRCLMDMDLVHTHFHVWRVFLAEVEVPATSCPLEYDAYTTSISTY